MRSQRSWCLLILASVVCILGLTVAPLPAAAPAKVPICDKPDMPDEHTLTVPENALSGHLDHGDFVGSCEGGSTSDAVQTGTEVRLALPGATFLAPADSLPAGVTVTLSGVNPTRLDPPPNVSGEEVFTQVFELRFSTTVPATKPLTLDLQIPTVIRQRFYSRLRVEGGIHFDGPPDSGWLVEIGAYDPAHSRLAIPTAGPLRQRNTLWPPWSQTSRIGGCIRSTQASSN